MIELPESVEPGDARVVAVSSQAGVQAFVRPTDPEFRAQRAEAAVDAVRAWVDLHRVGNGGFDCVQARDVSNLLEAAVDAW